MKKNRLLLVVFSLILAIVSSGQTTLTYRFANARIIRNSSIDKFEFDVQVKASQADTYLYSGQVMLNFNNTTFQTTTTNWTVTQGPSFAGLNTQSGLKYTVVKSLTGTPLVFNIGLVSDVNAFANGPSADDFTEILTSYMTLVTVKAPISDIAGLADISFLQSSMNGSEFYIPAPSTQAPYVNPNVYESADFMNTYVGRLFTVDKGWSQIGGPTNGTQFTNWATSVKTSVWDGSASLPAGSLSNASALRIHSGATLTIPPTGQLTAGSVENNTANGLTIQSDASGTGSLITSSATGSGSANVQRYMTTGAWHQVSPPLVGQTVADFLTATGNITSIATKSTSRGMMNYNNSDNTWSAYYTNGSGGTLAAGQGYMMRTDADAAVNFAGTLTTGNPSPLTLSGAGDVGWNLIGNPYSSAININNGTTSFLYSNQGALDLSNVGVYFWNQSTNQYDVVNYSGAGTEVATLGQGFFVKSISNGAQIYFTSLMQMHQNSAVLKSVKTTIPEIKLIASNDSKTASTSIKFIAGTSKGLDPGYDAGIFKLDASVSLYTRLVEDNGVQFMLQCLPNSDFNSMIIPVGIDSKAGGEVTFSTELMNLPTDCKVILEDKLNKTFTDLSTNVYKTTVAANSTVTDRFQIHTSYQTTGLSEDYFNGKLSAYAIRNVEIRINGEVSSQAIASLYDVQGRLILTKKLEAGRLNLIRTPNIKTAIYMLFVKDNEKLQGFKIPVKE